MVVVAVVGVGVGVGVAVVGATWDAAAGFLRGEVLSCGERRASMWCRSRCKAS